MIYSTATVPVNREGETKLTRAGATHFVRGATIGPITSDVLKQSTK
jgi:hypothetical protein